MLINKTTRRRVIDAAARRGWKRIPIMIVALLPLFATPGAHAVQSVDWLRVNPEAVSAGVAMPVLATAQVGIDAALLPTSVMLFRYDENGRYVARLGPMYDDSAHGYVLEGDGIFSVVVIFDEAQPMTVMLRATVAYRGQMRRVTSDLVPLLVQSTVTAEETLDTISELLSNDDRTEALNYFGGSEADRQAIVEMSDEARLQLADAFSNAQLVTDNGDVCTYVAPWVYLGQVLELEFTMRRNDMGEWIVISW